MFRLVLSSVILSLVVFSSVDGKKKKDTDKKWVITAKSHPHVKPVTGKNVRDLIMMPSRPVMLFVYNPKDNSENKDSFPAMFGAADSLHDYIDFVAMDHSTPDGKQIGVMFSVESTPCLRYFNPSLAPVDGGSEGEYVKHPIGYSGPSTAGKMVEFAMQAMEGHNIATVDDSVDWSALFSKYPRFALPRIILFTAQNTTAFAFKAASHEFRYGAMFGVILGAFIPTVDSDGKVDTSSMPVTLKSEIIAQIKPTKLPSVYVFPAGESSAPSAVIDDPELLTRSAFYGEIAKHVIPAAARGEAPGAFAQADEEERQTARQKEAARRSRREPLPVVVATDSDEWQSACIERSDGGVCVLALVEDIDRDVDHGELEKASKAFAAKSRTPGQIVVIPALPNWKIAKFFDAHEDGYPTVVFINPGKKYYHNFIGSFNERSLSTFFATKLSPARATKFNVDNVPEFNVGEAAVSGGDDGDDIISGDL